ncbi:MAG: hypothetical protein AAF467_15765 [Actinomycetota bacterium]
MDHEPERAAPMTVQRRRWLSDDLVSFVITALQQRCTWTMGVFGAIAEFESGGAPLQIRVDDGLIVAHCPSGAMQLDPAVPLEVFETVDPAGNLGPTVLAVSEASAPRPCSRLTRMGPDLASVHPDHRDHQVYDLGLGRRAGSFAVRTDDADLIARLDQTAASPPDDETSGLDAVAPALVAASPHRVVTGAAGRIEVYAPIPAADETSPLGCHTHLDPAHLAHNRDLPPGLDLPDNVIPAAVCYPGPGH